MPSFPPNFSTTDPTSSFYDAGVGGLPLSTTHTSHVEQHAHRIQPTHLRHPFAPVADTNATTIDSMFTWSAAVWEQLCVNSLKGFRKTSSDPDYVNDGARGLIPNTLQKSQSSYLVSPYRSRDQLIAGDELGNFLFYYAPPISGFAQDGTIPSTETAPNTPNTVTLQFHRTFEVEDIPFGLESDTAVWADYSAWNRDGQSYYTAFIELYSTEDTNSGADTYHFMYDAVAFTPAMKDGLVTNATADDQKVRLWLFPNPPSINQTIQGQRVPCTINKYLLGSGEPSVTVRLVPNPPKSLKA
jgi:hypothetical protein